MGRLRQSPALRRLSLVPGSAGFRSPRATKASSSGNGPDEQLAAARNYWLATVRPDGSPHVMPVWGIWLEGVLYFDTHPESQKVRNLRHQSRAVVHLENGSEVVILEGSVDVEEDDIEEGELFERVASLYEEKYGTRPFGAFGFRPRIGYAWRDDFTGSATRYAFD